ncbi:Similar to Xpc: DNA repair protein complementing XP-C cells homolog (Drosophila melanogaster) [Cotesia congregata]|uniref:Similar to Xpc: DNA repair protein complementing XP-C cells homolog (Drosophila melanogaster) n=1 Tax=Cotesia congregata TaxID=51543 RepID=A0A8J2EG38_COTCN|nr:Similar to Xpc: DNA repair protein complementing XP-C cells homolog (Drosophila melanogaster) [Cotesia congregata]
MSSSDESSDSTEYLVPSSKIDLSSSFFSTTASTSKSNPKVRARIESSSSSEDDELPESSASNAELLLEVMKNLEKINNPVVQPSRAPAPVPESSSRELSSEIADLLLKHESGLGSFKLPDNEEEEIPKEQKQEKEQVQVQHPDYEVPQEGVNITLPGTGMPSFKRKKNKVGLLCWLAHGIHLNKQINDPEVMSTVLSLIPSISYPKGRVDIKYIEQFTKWFRGVIKVEFNKENVPVTKELLLKRLGEKKVRNYRELVLLYIAALRAIGCNCRLVLSLCPPPMKPKSDQLIKSKKEGEGTKERGGAKDKEPGRGKKSGEGEDKEDKDDIRNTMAKKWSEKNKGRGRGRKGGVSSVVGLVSNSKVADKMAKEEAKKKAAELLREKFASSKERGVKKLKRNDEGGKKEEGGVEEEEGKRLRSGDKKEEGVVKEEKGKRLRSGKSEDKKEEGIIKEEKGKRLRSGDKKVEEVVKEEKGKRLRRGRSEDKIVKKRRSEEMVEKGKGTLSSVGKEENEEKEEKMETESESENSEKEFKVKKKLGVGRKNLEAVKEERRLSEKRRKVLSSDDEEDIVDVRDSRYLWAEVYVEDEESWISVSVPDNKVHCVAEIFKKAPSPVLYVVAWNSLGKLKDVTRRYCRHWLTVTRKQRIDQEWWTETLSPWIESNSVMSRAEDEALLTMELEQPLPDRTADYKGHPLYALARHLLKYEALYPPDCQPLGYLKNGEAIYSRHCVHTLRSRETWLREARVVNLAKLNSEVVFNSFLTNLSIRFDKNNQVNTNSTTGQILA